MRASGGAGSGVDTQGVASDWSEIAVDENEVGPALGERESPGCIGTGAARRARGVVPEFTRGITRRARRVRRPGKCRTYFEVSCIHVPISLAMSGAGSPRNCQRAGTRTSDRKCASGAPFAAANWIA